MSVAVLTDSTACLPPAMARQAGVEVVPLHILVGRQTRAEGVDIDAAEVAALLRKGKQQVSTSRPAPGELVQAYRQIAERTGCAAIVSMHLSSKLSGTVEAAQLAAAAVRSQIRVEVLDTRTAGMAMGYAAVSAGQAAAAGASVEEVLEVARRRVEAASVYFYVGTLEHLRRGGRVTTVSAFFGSALAIKPLLTVRDGEVQLSEKVRTRTKALARLEQRCVEAIERCDGPFDVAVHHLDWVEQARGLRDRLGEHLPEGVGLDLVSLGAVVGVHTGPATLAVVISPR